MLTLTLIALLGARPTLEDTPPPPLADRRWDPAALVGLGVRSSGGLDIIALAGMRFRLVDLAPQFPGAALTGACLVGFRRFGASRGVEVDVRFEGLNRFPAVISGAWGHVYASVGHARDLTGRREWVSHLGLGLGEKLIVGELRLEYLMRETAPGLGVTFIAGFGF